MVTIAQLDLRLCVAKLSPLVPGGARSITLHSDTVTHVPTGVAIDCDIDGYYLTAPVTDNGAPNGAWKHEPVFDRDSGDWVNSTTNPKTIALGWLLTVIEHAAIQVLKV